MRDYELGIDFEITDDFFATILERNPQRTTLKATPKKILALIREDPEVSSMQMAETIVGTTEDGIKYHLRKLKDQDKMKHVGSSKGGHWEIISESEEESKS